MKYINWHAVGIGCFVLALIAFVCGSICSGFGAVSYNIVGALEFIAGCVCRYVGDRLY